MLLFFVVFSSSNIVFFRKVKEYFQFLLILATAQGQCFLSTLFLTPGATLGGNTGNMHKIWKQKSPFLVSRFVLWQDICFLAALALSPSACFRFILSRLPDKWQALIFCSGNTSLALNSLRIQCRDYIKPNTETNTMAARGRKQDLHMMWHWKPRTGHIPDWKIIKQA